MWVTLALIFVYLTVYFKTDADGCLSVVIYGSGHVSAAHFTSTLHHLCLSPVNCLFLMFFLCENSSPPSFFALVDLTHAGILGDFFFLLIWSVPLSSEAGSTSQHVIAHI